MDDPPPEDELKEFEISQTNATIRSYCFAVVFRWHRIYVSRIKIKLHHDQPHIHLN
jgi:hypothetical protein